LRHEATPETDREVRTPTSSRLILRRSTTRKMKRQKDNEKRSVAA
jgi:hypothetical protein